MTESVRQGGVTLGDVRARFLAAEAELVKASRSLQELQSAIEALGEARGGLKNAATEIGSLGTHFQAAIDGLGQNLSTLRAGVEALKAGEPAQVLHQISATQGAIGELRREVSESRQAHADMLSGLDSKVSESRQAHADMLSGLDSKVSESRQAHADMLSGLDSKVSESRQAHADMLSGLDSKVSESRQAHADMLSGLDSKVSESRQAHADMLSGLDSKVSESRQAHADMFAGLEARNQRIESGMKTTDDSNVSRHGEIRADIASLRRQGRVFFAIALALIALGVLVVWPR